MEFASFYGITAPQIILVNVAQDTFDRAVAIFNNANDHNRLKNLKEEFNILEHFLNTVPVVNYTNADDRRLDFRIKQSTAYYETGKPCKNPLTKEELEEAKAYLKTVPQSLTSRIKFNGKIVDIAPNELAIIEFFFNKRKLLSRFKRSIVLNTFSEVRVFGAKLYDFTDEDGERLRRRVIHKLNVNTKSRDIIDDLFERCRADVEELKKCIKDAPTKQKVHHEVTISSDGKTVTHRPNFMTSQDDDLLIQLHNKDLLKFIGLQELRALYEMKKISEQFTIDFYNRKFGLDLDKVEYERAFRKLEDLGLVGLNFYSCDFFNNVLDSAFISQQEEMIINKESSLATVIDEVDRLLSSRMRFGEELQHEA